MILYFLRHGQADRSAWNGPDDLRPLTPYGRRRLEEAAVALDRLEVRPDLILTSPLTRALQTAEITAEGLGLEDRLVEDPRLGHVFGFRQLTAIVNENTDCGALLLVGHEPGFSTTVSALTGGSNIVFKKGGLARVDLYATDPPAGDLVWLLAPKVLAF